MSKNATTHNMNQAKPVTRSDTPRSVDDELAQSMKSMTLLQDQRGRHDRSATAKEIILKNLRIWAGKVYDLVGGDQKEKVYQGVLQNLLLNQGFDVAVEVPFSVLRRDQATGAVKRINRRADLIVSLPGKVDKVLIECKAKSRISKEDMEQVITYREHFGIDECYLVNFNPGLDVLRLREENVHVHARGIPPASSSSLIGSSVRQDQQDQSKQRQKDMKASVQPSAPPHEIKTKQDPRLRSTDRINNLRSPKLSPRAAVQVSETTARHSVSSNRRPVSMAVNSLFSSAPSPTTLSGKQDLRNPPFNTNHQASTNFKMTKNNATPAATRPTIKTQNPDAAQCTDRGKPVQQKLQYRRQSIPTPTNNGENSARRVAPQVVPSAPPEEDVFSHHGKMQNLLPMDRLRIMNNSRNANNLR
jgi:GxxExxY protein